MKRVQRMDKYINTYSKNGTKCIMFHKGTKEIILYSKVEGDNFQVQLTNNQAVKLDKSQEFNWV